MQEEDQESGEDLEIEELDEVEEYRDVSQIERIIPQFIGAASLIKHCWQEEDCSLIRYLLIEACI